MARTLRGWAINRTEKNSVRNLRYGPRTRLVSGISMFKINLSHEFIVNLKSWKIKVALTRFNNINFLNWQIVQRYALFNANKVECLAQTETSQLKEDTEGSLRPTVAENWITWFNSNSYFLHIECPHEPILCIKNIELVITLSVKYNLVLACFILWPTIACQYFLRAFAYSVAYSRPPCSLSTLKSDRSFVWTFCVNLFGKITM